MYKSIKINLQPNGVGNYSATLINDNNKFEIIAFKDLESAYLFAFDNDLTKATFKGQKMEIYEKEI